jgi:sporulation protein YunB
MRRWGKRQRAGTWKVIPLFIAIVSMLLLAIFEYQIKPSLIAIAEAKARIFAIEAITDAVETEIVQKTNYQDLMYVHMDNLNRPVLIQPDTIEISRVVARTTGCIQERLRGLEKEEIRIPLGQLSGSNIMASLGPKIRIGIVPLGTVTINMINNLEEAGINQTLHKILFDINTKVRVVIPLATEEIEVSHQVLLAQTVIVGQVPDSFLQLRLQ